MARPRVATRPDAYDPTPASEPLQGRRTASNGNGRSKANLPERRQAARSFQRSKVSLDVLSEPGSVLAPSVLVPELARDLNLEAHV